MSVPWVRGRFDRDQLAAHLTAIAERVLSSARSPSPFPLLGPRSWRGLFLGGLAAPSIFRNCGRQPPRRAPLPRRYHFSRPVSVTCRALPLRRRPSLVLIE